MLRTDDYLCNACGHEFEEIAEKDAIVPCSVCGGETIRQLSAPAIDWVHMGTDPGFPGAYSKWAKAKTQHHKHGKDSLRNGKGTSLLMH